eukprot:scaffold4099_cov73-Skeletonema_dohrnii-CCMP3373.AAC.4
MRFSLCTIATAVAGSFAILPKCNAKSNPALNGWEGLNTGGGGSFIPQQGEVGKVAPVPSSGSGSGNRQLSKIMCPNIPHGNIIISPATEDTRPGRGRTLTTVEDEVAKEEEPQRSLHVNATGLTANCEGCSVALTLIQTSLCSTTDAHDSALQVPLQDSLTYIADENGSTGGWKTQHFRELHDSNKTLPLSLVDVLNPDPATPTDYKIAVYLYDMEENPIACATLEQASEEEAKMYSDMFDFDGGEDDGPRC